MNVKLVGGQEVFGQPM